MGMENFRLCTVLGKGQFGKVIINVKVADFFEGSIKISVLIIILLFCHKIIRRFVKLCIYLRRYLKISLFLGYSGAEQKNWSVFRHQGLE